jgi:hypothetical protein
VFVVVVGVGGWVCCRGGSRFSGVRFGTVAKAATAVFGGATLARRIPIPLCPERRARLAGPLVRHTQCTHCIDWSNDTER